MQINFVSRRWAWCVVGARACCCKQQLLFFNAITIASFAGLAMARVRRHF
jgi:hypothetical protein